MINSLAVSKQSVKQIRRVPYRKELLIAFSIGAGCGIGVTFLTSWLFSKTQSYRASIHNMQQQNNNNAADNQSWLWYFVGLPWRVLGAVVPYYFGGRAGLPSSPTGSFADDFELRYGNVHPHWCNSSSSGGAAQQAQSFQQVCQLAKTQFKFIFVYLHSSLHQDSDQFCREVMSNEIVQDVVDTNFLSWAGNINSDSEAYKLSQLLTATSYPFIAVLGNNAMGGITILDKVEGTIGVDDLISRLSLVLEAHGPELQAQRIQSEELVMNRQLRQEQDDAFQQSLREDQEKERKAQEEVRLAEAAREAALLEEQRRQQQQQQKANRKQQLVQKLGAEPSAADKDVTQLVIRLPDGSRLQRRFKINQLLQDVFDYVESQSDTIAPSLDGVHHSFELVTHFPRRVYSETNQTLAQLQLTPHASLFLQEK